MNFENESESDHSHASDINYVPSEEESLDESPEKIGEKKNSKRSSKRSNQTHRSKKKKADRSPIKSKNHNEFFKNFDGFVSKSPEKSVETAENSEISTVPEDSIELIESSQKSPHTLRKNDSNTEHSNKSMQDDVSELKSMVYGLQRQLARVETLIKFQKESAVDSDDIHSKKGSYIQILQHYGLPIASKEKLDEIEKNLKIVDFKSKLVCYVFHH